MLLFIWTVALITALALFLRRVYSTFERAGLHYVPPFPLLGNMAPALFRRCHFAEVMTRISEEFPDDRLLGFYEFLSPVLVATDLELLKKITVKDFEHFVDRRGFSDDFRDPLFGRNLLTMKGEEWKEMRSTLSPAFTSSKIRLMVPFMVEVCGEMIKTLKRKMNESGVGHIDVETKDLSTRYANDVIASCAFGLKVDSQNQNNEFYNMCKEITTFKLKNLLKLFAYRSLPKIMKMLNVQFSSPTTSRFFKELVLGTMKQREEHNIIRNDMIHILMEVKKGNLTHSIDTKEINGDAGFATVEESAVGKRNCHKDWTDTELVAQAVLFLLAGFETISTVLSFCLHELAIHPDIQDRLVQELQEYDSKNGGKLDYGTIQNMKYMDMFVSEVLRLWPPAPMVDRLCVKDYNAGRPHPKAERDYIIRKGQSVNIPVWTYHHNPNHFPDPYKFDPERFSDDNKHLIKPFTYMPFGLGPRNCIGSRFALCEVKVMLYELLKYIQVSPCAKTTIPSRLDLTTFQTRLAGGSWVRLSVRQ